MDSEEEYKQLLEKKSLGEKPVDKGTEEHGEDETYTVEEAIEKLGFGWFQVKLLSICGVSWMADSMEMSILAILGPAVRCEWTLTHWHEAFLTTDNLIKTVGSVLIGWQKSIVTAGHGFLQRGLLSRRPSRCLHQAVYEVVFIGMFVSTYFWGFSTDKYGRKSVIVLATFGVFFYGLISAASPKYSWILILRGMVGFSMGGVVQGTTLIAEYLPRKARGLTINLSSIFWSIGTSIEVLSAMFVMPSLGWRWQLFISALPSLIFLSISKFLPESARFYVTSGQPLKAIEMLNKVSEGNGKELPKGRLKEVHQGAVAHRGSILEMFRGDQWKTTLPLWCLWFGSHFNIYGLALLTTSLYSSGYSCYGSSPSPMEDIGKCDYCKELNAHDYLHFFLVLTADFLGVIVVAILADTIGRKLLQAVGFLAMGFFFALLFICTHSKNWTTFFLFGVRCFAAVADIGGYIYTPEVYPTHIRGIALGSCSGISRVGCMLTPFVAQVLAHHSIHLTIAIYCFVSLSGFICSLILPIETKGKGLFDNEDSDKAKLTS